MWGGRGSDATRRAAVGRHSPVRCGRQRRFHGVHGVHRALRWALRDGVTVTGAAWGGWGGGAGSGRRESCGAAPPPPPPPPRCGEVRSSRGHIPPPPRLPALGLGVLPGTAPPARACPAASPGGAPARPQRCGTEAGSGTPPPSPSHSVTPTGVDPTGDGTPQRHLLGSPLGTRQLPPPPTPPFLPSVTAGRGNPRGLPPPPGAAHPHRGYFPPSERSATLSVPPRPRAGVAGRGRLRAPRCQRYRGGGGGTDTPTSIPAVRRTRGGSQPGERRSRLGGSRGDFQPQRRSAPPARVPPPPPPPPLPPHQNASPRSPRPRPRSHRAERPKMALAAPCARSCAEAARDFQPARDPGSIARPWGGGWGGGGREGGARGGAGRGRAGPSRTGPSRAEPAPPRAAHNGAEGSSVCAAPPPPRPARPPLLLLPPPPLPGVGSRAPSGERDTERGGGAASGGGAGVAPRGGGGE